MSTISTPADQQPVMRLRDWQSRLQAYLADRQDQPFTWGSQDCCMFVFDARLVLTGADPAADLRGTYSTEREAARLLRELGGVRTIAADRFGAEIAPAFAGAGDIGLVETAGRESLALCGGTCWLAPGEGGLLSMPLSAALAAWRIC